MWHAALRKLKSSLLSSIFLLKELQPSGWMGVALQVSTSLQAVEQRTGTCPRILTSYEHSEPPRNASILIQRRWLARVWLSGDVEAEGPEISNF